jgi:hypothetical protein
MGQPPSNMIAGFASDFHPSAPDYPKTILYKNVAGKLVVTFLKAQPKTGSGPASYASFQIVLYPTGKIKIQWLEFGPSYPTANGSVYIVNADASAYHMYAYGGQAGSVTGTSPIAVAYGQNAYMFGDAGTDNDLPQTVSGTGSASFPATGATVQFVTSTASTNLTALRLDVNPGGTLPEGLLSLANRHWTISSTTSTGLGTYNLTLNLSGIPNLAPDTAIYLVKRNHVYSSWSNLGLPSVYDFQARTATWQISSGFSDFGLGFETNDQTLPVVLSSFTATLNAENFVALNWVTQSESGLSGYYVYRSQQPELTSSIIVSPLIAGTNSSQQQNYSFTDRDLYDDGLYYYWLQSYNLDGSSDFHGPVSVVYNAGGDDPGAPDIPLVTGLTNVYPNPFNPDAWISYGLKESIPLRIVIYNSRGQIIRSFDDLPAQAGSYRLRWDGRDKSGSACSSGIYYIRMSAGKEVFTRRAALLK